MKPTAPLPGGIGLTHLRVYDSVAPDGWAGGSAHVHFACTEAYYVIAGRGRVQTLGPDGYRELPLVPGGLVWFTPGLIHRLINEDGKLEILVPMQNAGLPEAGDFVLCFPPEILADPDAYNRAASLASAGHVHATSADAARARRDLAVEGFHSLRAQFEAEGVGALEAFYRLVLPLVAPRLASWATLWENGPLRIAQETGMQLDALGRGEVGGLMTGSGVWSLDALPEDARKWGMCGTLGTYLLPEGECLAR